MVGLDYFYSEVVSHVNFKYFFQCSRKLEGFDAYNTFFLYKTFMFDITIQRHLSYADTSSKNNHLHSDDCE